MVSEKIQDLIGVLKQQGVHSGEIAGREIEEAARKKADEIIMQAKLEAETIVKQANVESERTLKRLQSAMEVAATQFVGNLKRTVEENLLTIPLKTKIKEDLSDPDFLKKLILEFVRVYAGNPKQTGAMLTLPADASDELKQFSIELMGKYFGKGDPEKLPLVMTSQEIKFGFLVDKTDGNVRLDFSDQAFIALFLRFLTPRFREYFSGAKSGAGIK